MRPTTRSKATNAEPTRGARARLAREQQRTLAELQQALSEAGDELCALEDVRAWVKQNPGLALAAGTALGALLAPAVGRALPLLLSLAPSGSSLTLLRGLRRALR